jgi:hypothetical protein
VGEQTEPARCRYSELIAAEPHITVLGGVPAQKVEQSGPNLGMTAPDAVFQETGLPVDGLGRPRPFAGQVSVHGEGITAGMTLYRLVVRNVTKGTGYAPVTTKFWVTDLLGNPVPVTPGPDGWLVAPAQNSTHLLGWIDTTGDDLWAVQLEVPSSLFADVKSFQLNNTGRPGVRGSLAHPHRPAAASISSAIRHSGVSGRTRSTSTSSPAGVPDSARSHPG